MADIVCYKHNTPMLLWLDDDSDEIIADCEQCDQDALDDAIRELNQELYEYD